MTTSAEVNWRVIPTLAPDCTTGPASAAISAAIASGRKITENIAIR